MAVAVLTGLADIYPVGTSVGAYAAAQEHSGRAPTGSAVETQSVASGGSLTFSALQPSTDYVAYAKVGSEHRYVDFMSSPGTTAAVSEADLPWVNVKDEDFGALGDGSTDDHGAIQAAINYVQGQGRGTLLLPPGDFVVNDTLTVQPELPLRIVGAGMALDSDGGVGWPTRLRRASGTQTLFEAIGTSASNMVRVELCDLELRGVGAGILADIQIGHSCYLHRVRFVGNAGIGLRLRQIYNASADNLYITNCGSGSGSPAFVMDAVSGVSGSGVQTMHFTNVEIEGSGGTPLKLTGDLASASPTTDVSFVNLKVEGHTVNGTGVPYIDLDYAAGCRFFSTWLNLHGDSAAHDGTVTPIQQGTTTGLGIPNIFNGLHLKNDNAGGGTVPYWIQDKAGALQLANVSARGSSVSPPVATAGIRIESAVGADEFQAKSLMLGSYATISDARTRFQYVRDDVEVKPRVRAYNSAAISIANNVLTALTFNSERYDNGTTTEMHSTSSNTGRLTSQLAGIHHIFATLRFAANATGYRLLAARLNGTTLIAAIRVPAVADAGIQTNLNVSTDYFLAVGDYIEFVVLQTSGGALDVEVNGNNSPEVGMTWLTA